MKSSLIFTVLVALSLGVAAQSVSFHDFAVKDINGNDFALSSLKGKKVLVVNTASKCGLTKQYADLEKLYKEYGGDTFTVIGFPANNFMGQEPGSNEEILEFCSKEYGVSFPMMAKISVKGDDIHPLYAWLTQKSANGVTDSEVKWNFQKFMINPDGTLAGFVEPKAGPYDERILSWIKQ